MMTCCASAETEKTASNYWLTMKNPAGPTTTTGYEKRTNPFVAGA